MSISCHVLDASLGKPAANVAVSVHAIGSDALDPLAVGETDKDGRCTSLIKSGVIGAGKYKVSFLIEPYFEQSGRECFYPVVEISFNLKSTEEHYHIPLLISPYSFTTYRGS